MRASVLRRGTELNVSRSRSRDQLVAHAVGLKTWGGVNYYTVAQNITGLMRAGSEGVNHGAHPAPVACALVTDCISYRHRCGWDCHPADRLRNGADVVTVPCSGPSSTLSPYANARAEVFF